jgi:hypothetical protein
MGSDWSVSLSSPLQYIADPMILNVLYQCLHHYNTLLTLWLWMFCSCRWYACMRSIIYRGIRPRPSFQFKTLSLVDIYKVMILGMIWIFFIASFDKLLWIHRSIFWMLINVYTITIHCWPCDYECSVSLSISLHYIVDPMIINVLYHCLYHYNILVIPWILMFFITLYNITI